MSMIKEVAEERTRALFEEQLADAEGVVAKDLSDAGMDELTDRNLQLLEFGNSEVPARGTKSRLNRSFNAKPSS